MDLKAKAENQIEKIKEKLTLKANVITEERNIETEEFLSNCFEILNEIDCDLPKADLQEAFQDAKKRINENINDLFLFILKKG